MLHLKVIKNKISFYKDSSKSKCLSVYVGYLGRNNFGDDLLYEVHQKINNSAFVPCLDIFNIQKTSNVDKVVLGGGTIINGDIYLRVIKKLAVRPSYTFCSGVIEGKVSKEWVNMLKDTAVYTRSIESASKLEKSGVNAIPFVDPGVFASILYPPDVKVKPNSGLYFTLCPHGKSSSLINYRKIIEACKRFQNSKITLFASSFEDLSFCLSLAKYCECTIFRGWEDIELANSIISRSNLVVATRLHPSVVASSYGVPFIMLSYEGKQKEFVNSIGADGRLFDEGLDISSHIECLIGTEGKLKGIKQWHAKYSDFIDLFGS
jgi:hypothetical protein